MAKKAFTKPKVIKDNYKKVRKKYRKVPSYRGQYTSQAAKHHSERVFEGYLDEKLALKKRTSDILARMRNIRLKRLNQ